VRPLLAIALLACLAAFPESAQAQLRPDAVRVGGYFAMGAGGTNHVTGGRRMVRPSPPGFTTVTAIPFPELVDHAWSDGPFWGGGVRVEKPVARFLVLGGNVELYRHPIDIDPSLLDGLPTTMTSQPRRRGLTSHYDLWLKLVPFVSGERRVPLELYVAIPVGFTLSTASLYSPYFSRSNEPIGSLSDQFSYPFARTKWYGVDTGVLLGTQLLIHERFGLHVEAGLRTVHTYNRLPFPSTSPGWRAVHSASYYGALNLGAMLFF